MNYRACIFSVSVFVLSVAFHEPELTCAVSTYGYDNLEVQVESEVYYDEDLSSIFRYADSDYSHSNLHATEYAFVPSIHGYPNP